MVGVNLQSPVLLLKDNPSKHIFNLSHGVLPKTPVQNVTKTIDTVRNYESRKSTS